MRSIIYICTLLFCVSCANNQTRNNVSAMDKYGIIDSAVFGNSQRISSLNSDETINIKLDKSSKNSPVKRWNYINLDDKNSPIGVIDKIVVYDSLIFALSVNNSKSLTSFNITTGNCVAKYGDIGRSSSEYIEPTDFLIRNDSVIILDNRSKKLLYYDLSGKYLSSQRLKFALKAIVPKTNSTNIYGIAGENQHIRSISDALVLEIDSRGNIVSQHLDRPIRVNVSSLETINNVDDNITVYEKFTSQYISIMESEDKLLYNVDFSNNGLPNNYLKECKGSYRQFSEKYKSKYSYVNKFFETDNYLFISYTNKGSFGYLGIYDKQQSRIMYNKQPSFQSQKPDIEELLLMNLSLSPICCFDDGYAIKMSDAYTTILKTKGLIEDSASDNIIFLVYL